MPIPKLTGAQVDFRGGEIDEGAVRSAATLAKAGVRQARNFRSLATGGFDNRPGRRIMFLADGRVDRVKMAPGSVFFLHFSNLTLSVLNAAGAIVFTSPGFSWNVSTVRHIRWVVYNNQIAIAFQGQIPKILTWDGTLDGGWSLADYTERLIGNQKRTVFYRLAPKGITLSVSGLTGAINITFSAPVLNVGMIGTRIRFNGRQLIITGVTTPTTGTANVAEPLDSNVQTVTVSSAAASVSVGDVLWDDITGAQGQVLSVAGLAANVRLQSTTRFGVGHSLVKGTTFIGPISAVADVAPDASVVWDQEVMNASAGYPASVFFDQNRLGFCNFPSVPGGIAWSAVNAFTDLYPDAFAADGLATDAIFEIVPEKGQVFDVIGAAEGHEIVLCDNRVWYIPISFPSNPLAPGSVAFRLITADGAANVAPKLADEVAVYVAAGALTLQAIVATGSQTRVYRSIEITGLYYHLIIGPIGIAIPQAGGSIGERYIYVQNSDGSLAIGCYDASLKDLKEGSIGWVPWSGGTGKWVSAEGADVIFTSSYQGVAVCEVLDNSRYLDASQFYNTQPAGIPIPVGKGPLWWMANGSVDLVDNGTRMMGTYQVDANGFLVPQFQAGEDFTSATLVAGQAWVATFEPFTTIAQAGQDVGQRVKQRRISRFEVYVENSTGFVFQRLFGGKQTPTGPALGTVMNYRRVPAWNVGDNVLQPPPLRAGAFQYRPAGRTYDPRVCVVKDTPGPLRIIEAAMEITV